MIERKTQMKNDRKHSLILIFLLITTLVIFLFRLYLRSINGDEVILAEQVLSLQKFGFVKAELFDGMGKGWEIRQFHFHKFFIFLSAFISSIFGFNIWLLRLIPLMFFIGLIFLLFKYLKTVIPENKLILGGVLIVLLACFKITEFAFLFRPEIILASLGFLSFLLLFQFFEKKNIWLCIGSGAIAGLAAFTHLNGVSYIMAGGLLLLINSRWKGAFLFGLSATLVSLLYFYDLNSMAELTAFWEQFRSDPNLSESDFKIFHALIKVFNEHMRFFWNVPTAGFSLLYFFCLITNFSYFKKNHPTLFWYHLILIGCLSAIAQSKTVKYGLVYYPFMVLVISIAMNRFFTNSNTKKQKWLHGGVLAIYFITNIGFTIWSMTGKSTAYLIQKNQAYTKLMTKKEAGVFTTESFYFNSYQNFTIHSILAYSLLHEIYLQTPRTQEGFYNFAERNHNDYILVRNRAINRDLLTLIDFDKLSKGAINYNYKVIFKDSEAVIMEYIAD